MPVQPADSNRRESQSPATHSPRAMPAYRPSQAAPQHDEKRLAQIGIHPYRSRHLTLYTDLPASEAEALPPLADLLVAELTAYFGEPPPNREGTPFHMTGYLLRDRTQLLETGLAPEDLPVFAHGLHRGAQFWMYDQTETAYREHLLLHEATHCFMTILPGSSTAPWFQEGMAEVFATHRQNPDGKTTFRILPQTPQEYRGFGRITLIREEIAAGRFKTADQVRALPRSEFLQPAAYAWSWALCEFFSRHPSYRDRFRQVAQVGNRPRLELEFRQAFEQDAAEINDGWALFAHELTFGYDLERAVVQFERQRPQPALSSGVPNGDPLLIAADRGWQSSGLPVQAGSRYALVPSGQVSLAQQPQPWMSEFQGISYEYFDGVPIGQLLVAVRSDDPRQPTDSASGLLTPQRVLPDRPYTAPHRGVLYFRVNDAWNHLSDNRGNYRVIVKPTS